MTSDTITDDIKELANGMIIILEDSRGLWNADDIVSIFDEITSELCMHSFYFSVTIPLF